MADEERNTPPESNSGKPVFDDIEWEQLVSRLRERGALSTSEQSAHANTRPVPEQVTDNAKPEAPAPVTDAPTQEISGLTESIPPYEPSDQEHRHGPLPPPDALDIPGQEPTESKPHRRRAKVRSLGVTFLVAVLYVVCVLSIAFLAATFGWRWANDLLALNKDELTASITVEAGDSIEEVASKLEDAGLIEYSYLFEIYAAFTNKAESVTSGTYELTTDMDYSALLNNMSTSSTTRETVTVTIPEGYTVAEIFQLLEDQGACTVEALEYSALNDEFSYSFLSDLNQDDPYWMEGYLFPDTYEFYKDGDAKVALSKMLYNYSQKFDSDMKARAELLGYSQHEIMIVASIIEKETDGEDQKDIASVIYNRLQTAGETLGKLQMDSTIQYILEERKEQLTEEDLAIDSPYNTYLYEGLPAGTICNPGMEAIEAALYPNNTTYYYFILGDDGSTHFFATYEEFNNYRSGITTNTSDSEITDDDFYVEDEDLGE